MKEENKEIDQINEAAKNSLPTGIHEYFEDGFFTGFHSGVQWHSQEAILITANASYTQEQMIAFGEAVKKECAENAMLDWYDLDKVRIDKQSILEIDISKFLKK